MNLLLCEEINEKQIFLEKFVAATINETFS